MNDEQPLMRLDGLALVVEPSSFQMRDDLLGSAELVQVVTDENTNKMAFEVQAALLGVVRAVKKTQDELKKPLNVLRGTIDAKAREFYEPLVQESTRLSKLMGDWHVLQEEKRRAADNARLAELRAAEKQREAEISKATSLDEVTDIRERYQEQVLTIAAPPPVEKPSAQIVKDVWRYEVTDIWLLARMHPTCVKIEPRTQQIKELLDAGCELAGVKAWKEKSVTARTG